MKAKYVSNPNAAELAATATNKPSNLAQTAWDNLLAAMKQVIEFNVVTPADQGFRISMLLASDGTATYEGYTQLNSVGAPDRAAWDNSDPTGIQNHLDLFLKNPGAPIIRTYTKAANDYTAPIAS